MKYTREQLRSMAQEFLAAQKAGDPHATFLVLALSARTGVSPMTCVQAIQQLAQPEQETTENEQQPTN